MGFEAVMKRVKRAREGGESVTEMEKNHMEYDCMDLKRVCGYAAAQKRTAAAGQELAATVTTSNNKARKGEMYDDDKWPAFTTGHVKKKTTSEEACGLCCAQHTHHLF